MKYGKYILIKNADDLFSENPLIKTNRMEQEMEKMIWEYMDGLCSPAIREMISRHLAEDPEWKMKYKELKSIHLLLQNEELEMPSLRFTKNVMEEIAQYQVAPATRNYVNKYIIRGITAFFLIMIVGFFIYFVGQLHWSSSPSNHVFPDSLDGSKVNWNKLLNNSYINILMGISAMLGLVLVDRYMRTKKNEELTGRDSKMNS